MHDEYPMKALQPSIAEIAIDTPLRRSFDYTFCAEQAQALTPGLRVKVPFGKRILVGIIIQLKTKTNIAKNKLKPILEILDPASLLDPALLQLLHWASTYYHHPIGEVYFTALPPKLRKDERAALEKPNKKTGDVLKEPTLSPNPDQARALHSLHQAPPGFSVFLLEGVTGSGKTEVYLQGIQPVLEQGQSALILIPEIALSPQTIARFEARFNTPIILLHSSLSPKKRTESWLKAQQSTCILIGTRSAVFTPCAHLGIIIVDEEHDPSFKQFEGFRYSARDVALKRAQLYGIPIVLGSATPSLESLHNTKNRHYTHLQLPHRAGTAQLPQFKLVDTRQHTLNQGLSAPIIKLIQQTLDQKQQVLLFLNRRGFAPRLTCLQCNWIAPCPRCDAQLTLHHEKSKLCCHHCQTVQTIPQVCPECQLSQLVPVGTGTERIETHLTHLFSSTRIIRIDSDSTKKRGSLQEKLLAINSENAALLVGTQMLAKGHHFPKVSVVIILEADSGLHSIDFRAEERMAQLLLQVAGRAGRANTSGQVIIQTRHPDHPLLQAIVAHDYPAITAYCLQQRQTSRLPPFSYLALLRAQSTHPDTALDFLTEVRTHANTLPHNEAVILLGPIPALMTKRAGYYRAQLLLQATHRGHLHPFITQLLKLLPTLENHTRVRWSLDVDPVETL